MSPITLIAAREVGTRVRTKSFIWSTLLTAVIIGVAAFLPNIISLFQQPTHIGVTGAAAEQTLTGLDTEQFTLDSVSSESDARERIERGDLAAALISSADTNSSTATQATGQPSSSGSILPHYTLLVSEGFSTTDTATITQLAHNTTQAQVLVAHGIDLTELQQQINAAAPTLITVGEPTQATIDPVAIGITMAISLVLFMQLFGAGFTVAQGVVEEKSSRVVEILLATVSPRQLLVGKVLGIGVIGLLQLLIILTVGITAARVSGLVEDGGQLLATAALSVAWFIPGYLFYAFAYAAAGSMVSRQEDIGQTTNLLTFLSMSTVYAAVFGVQHLEASWVKILSVIPPFSALLMPVRIIAEQTSPGEIALAAGLLVVLVVAAALLGSRIYRNSVLRTGARVKLGQVLRGGNA